MLSAYPDFPNFNKFIPILIIFGSSQPYVSEFASASNLQKKKHNYLHN